jgi:hypothetical protein
MVKKPVMRLVLLEYVTKLVPKALPKEAEENKSVLIIDI